jgi:hypothetical protein
VPYQKPFCSAVVARRAVSLTFIIIGALWSLTTPLEAGVIFTNIVGNCCGGQGIDGANYDGGVPGLAAGAFIPAGPSVLSDAQVEVSQVIGFGGDPYFNVSLYSNAAGVPGSLIATIGTDLTAPAGGGLVTASGPTPLLIAGTEYWLVLSPFDSGTEVGWETGGAPAAEDAVLGAGNWVSVGQSTLQFQIDAVPEPASWALVIAAFALIATHQAILTCLRRRRS